MKDSLNLRNIPGVIKFFQSGGEYQLENEKDHAELINSSHE